MNPSDAAMNNSSSTIPNPASKGKTLGQIMGKRHARKRSTQGPIEKRSRNDGDSTPKPPAVTLGEDGQWEYTTGFSSDEEPAPVPVSSDDMPVESAPRKLRKRAPRVAPAPAPAISDSDSDGVAAPLPPRKRGKKIAAAALSEYESDFTPRKSGLSRQRAPKASAFNVVRNSTDDDDDEDEDEGEVSLPPSKKGKKKAKSVVALPPRNKGKQKVKAVATAQLPSDAEDNSEGPLPPKKGKGKVKAKASAKESEKHPPLLGIVMPTKVGKNLEAWIAKRDMHLSKVVVNVKPLPLDPPPVRIQDAVQGPALPDRDIVFKSLHSSLRQNVSAIFKDNVSGEERALTFLSIQEDIDTEEDRKAVAKAVAYVLNRVPISIVIKRCFTTKIGVFTKLVLQQALELIGFEQRCKIKFTCDVRVELGGRQVKCTSLYCLYNDAEHRRVFCVDMGFGSRRDTHKVPGPQFIEYPQIEFPDITAEHKDSVQKAVDELTYVMDNMYSLIGSPRALTLARNCLKPSKGESTGICDTFYGGNGLWLYP
ncbi:hypothetical protein K458DRAFT_389625 [Lentithecium fluviatile CBS 122367]|uniref:Uncharacterized protein n=1 Tax=Lentithecium fluviatile CBS 122367 TaxID=1168545 RepID=A0A6G1J034_9PLEO|nr:hypothetical protein K458DRAFT_389625 [Lentithecium fluviatile CBS 122367]